MLGFPVSLAFLLGPVFAPAPDRVVLRNGAVLEGKILFESESYLEILLGEGQKVGIPRGEAKEIHRSAEPETPKPAPPPAGAPLPEREERFLVENRGGKVVALVRALVRRLAEAPSESLRLEEHWSFPEPGGELRVSWVETLGPGLHAGELLYREEGAGAGKVVLARVAGGVLEVEVSGGPEKRRLQLPWKEESRFPLQARAELREKAMRMRGEIALQVFDPGRLCFSARRYVLGEKRSIPWEEDELPVFVVREEGDPVANEEWIDPRLGSIRREANGPDLVARRATDEQLEAFRKGESVAAESWVSGPGKKFRLVLPDPRWRVLSAPEADSLLLAGGEEKSKALFFFVDGESPSSSPSSVLPALERRLEAALEQYRREGLPRERILQSRPGLEFGFAFLEDGERRSGVGLLLGVGQNPLAVLYTFPRREHATVPADWERLLARLQIQK